MLWLLKKQFYHHKEQIKIKGFVVAVIKDKKGKIKRIETGNIVTNEGDKYYAQKSAGETPAINFQYLRLGSDTTAPTKNDTDVITFLSGTGKLVSIGYPKTNDTDPNNTGAGIDIVTWKFFYDTNEANYTNINEGAIVDDPASPTAALCRFVFSSTISKSSSETLTIYVNHTFTGV